MEILRENVRRERERRGWSQSECAERSGMSLRGIQNVEAGDRFPREENVAGIARAFGLEEWRLFVPQDAAPRPTPAEALDVLREALEERQPPRTLLRAAEPSDPPEVAFLRSLPPEDPAWDIVREVMKTKAKGKARKAD
jgi:transcriptional regulator with XRE-family HTH domain